MASLITTMTGKVSDGKREGEGPTSSYSSLSYFPTLTHHILTPSSFEGTMEAVYWGTCDIWGKGEGTGPWLMADLENVGVIPSLLPSLFPPSLSILTLFCPPPSSSTLTHLFFLSNAGSLGW